MDQGGKGLTSDLNTQEMPCWPSNRSRFILWTWAAVISRLKVIKPLRACPVGLMSKVFDSKFFVPSSRPSWEPWICSACDVFLQVNKWPNRWDVTAKVLARVLGSWIKMHHLVTRRASAFSYWWVNRWYHILNDSVDHINFYYWHIYIYACIVSTLTTLPWLLIKCLQTEH